MAEARRLVYPGIVPIKVLSALARAGVPTTKQVHQHIMDGTLESLKGIGPKMAAKVLRYYTER